MSAGAISDAAPWPSYALPRGISINGYRIDRVLGSGGFGITYLAHDLLQQRFAIKEYFPRQFALRQGLEVVAASAEDTPLFQECRDRFLREAKALVVLSRLPEGRGSIVRVQTYFESHGTCFLVMDYVEGASLAAVLREEPNGLAANRVQSLLLQLLSSIRIVHRAGLMHRDIKPANIILGDDDRLVLIDFGSSRETTRADTLAYTQIYSGGYAPPEQILGLPQGEFSDIYAIGAVCYRAIGGKVVNALARQNARAAGQSDPQPSAEQVGAGRYPKKLLAAIDRAMAIDPMRRPQSVDEMLSALEPDPAAEAPTVIAAQRAMPAAAPRSRGRFWGIVAACGGVALVGAMAAVFFLREPAGPAPSIQQQAAVVPAPPVVPPQPADAAPAQATPEPTARPAASEEKPQQEAVVVPPPAPGAPVPPPAQPAEEKPQQEAIVVPPPALPRPAPPPPSPLERAQAAALTVPCAVLHVGAEQDRMRIAGLAAAGQELDRLLTDVSQAGPVADNILRIDHTLCAPIATMAPLIRQTWESEPRAIALRVAQPEVTSGARLGIDIDAGLPVRYVDIFQPDGSVRHLLRAGTVTTANRDHVEWSATPPAGPRLVLAIGSAQPLDIGNRPEMEATTVYLQSLQPLLERAASRVAADLAIVTVRAAEPAVMKVPQRRPTPVRSERCANIISRAQLGERLSDAELAVLRSECKS